MPALVTEPPFPTYTVSAEIPEMLRAPPDSLSTEPEPTRTAIPCPVIEPALVTVPTPPSIMTPA